MLELALLVPSLVLGFLVWHQSRIYERAEHARRLERVGLLNRIQAPEVAAYQDDAKPSEAPPYIPVEDDAAWDEYAEQKEAGEAV